MVRSGSRNRNPSRNRNRSWAIAIAHWPRKMRAWGKPPPSAAATDSRRRLCRRHRFTGRAARPPTKYCCGRLIFRRSVVVSGARRAACTNLIGSPPRPAATSPWRAAAFDQRFLGSAAHGRLKRQSSGLVAPECVESWLARAIAHAANGAALLMRVGRVSSMAGCHLTNIRRAAPGWTIRWRRAQWC